LQEQGQSLSDGKCASLCSGKSGRKISEAHAGIARKSRELGKSLKIRLGSWRWRRFAMQRGYRDTLTKLL